MKWHKGPPPSIGWWPTKDPECLRWWNGKQWSLAAWPHFDIELVAEAAARPTTYTTIEWTDRPASWPQRSKT